MNSLAYILVFAIGLHGSLVAQNLPEVRNIERSAAVYAAAHFFNETQVIAFDPVADNSGSTDSRSSGQIAELAGALRATKIGPKASFYSCSGVLPSTCSVREVDAVVSVGTPTVQGDAAFVSFVILKRTGFVRVPVQRRTTTLKLERRGDKWIVVGQLGQSVT